jgi:Zn-dependent protease with chaperone function
MQMYILQFRFNNFMFIKTYYAKYNPDTYEQNVTLGLGNKRLHITYQNTPEPFESWDYKDIQVQHHSILNKTIITKGNNKLVIEDINATKDFQQQMDYAAKPFFKRIFSGGSGKALLVLTIILGFLVGLYFLLVPYFSEKLAMRLPKSFEINTGEKLYKSIVNETIRDEIQTQLLNDYFKTLQITTDYPIQITVLKDNTVNAFAIMGGHIVVYTGLLEKIQHHEELAALLSHEFTHINNRHTTRSIFRSLGSRVFLGLLLGNTGGVSNIILNNATKFTSLGYSRNLEKEADIEGLTLLAERNINCNGFVQLMEHLKDASGGKTISEFLNSHPDIDKRIAYLKANAKFSIGNTTTTNNSLQKIFVELKGVKNDF